MKKCITILAAVTLCLALIPITEAAPPLRGGGVGVGLQRARVINPGFRNVNAFRGVNAVRALGFGLGGLGYRNNFGLGLGIGYQQNFGLGLGFGGYNQQAFVQQAYAQPFVQQSYSLVQPMQAYSQVQAFAQPVYQQQQFISQAVTGGCGVQALGVGGCGVQALGVGGCGAQALIGGVGSYGLGLGVQPFARQRFIQPRIQQGFRIR